MTRIELPAAARLLVRLVLVLGLLWLVVFAHASVGWINLGVMLLGLAGLLTLLHLYNRGQR